MGNFVLGALAPHPPIIIEEVGGRERIKAAKTIAGLEELARDLVAEAPDTIVFISPHGPVFQDGIVILGEEKLKGDFKAFGAPQLQLEYANDTDLAGRIAGAAGKKGIFAAVADRAEARRYRVKLELDHGVMVPLEYFSRAGFKGKVVVMGMAWFQPSELYDFGMAIQQAVEAGPGRVAVVASGDLSHRLTPEAPAGYNLRGREFDQAVYQALKERDFIRILDLEPSLLEAAGECGYRPLNILLGAIDGYDVESRVYSYEGPFGVGYLVAGLAPKGKSGVQGKLVEDFRNLRRKRAAGARLGQHPVTALAMASLEHYLRTGEYLDEYPPLTGDLPQRAGVFVSLKKHGELRGCIGTIAATQPDLAREVIHNAVSAGTEDPRFFPIELEELPELTCSVDILGEEEPIDSEADLDPKLYGVIVRRGRRSGLLLPNLEGVDSVEEQLRIVRQKAGIGPDEPVELSRFEVKRYYSTPPPTCVFLG